MSEWRDLGRKLVLATNLPDGEISTWPVFDRQDVVVICLSGNAVDLATRRALTPDMVDAVLLDAIGEEREEAVELARVLRGRGVGVVLGVTPGVRWGREVAREFLTVDRIRMESGPLWDAVDAAARWTKCARVKR